MTKNETEVLDEVREAGPLTAREIARNTGMSESTARRTLAKLEADGLVESDNYQRPQRVWMPK